MSKPFGYIYQILFPNGKRYVGQTINLRVRKSKYKTLNCKRQPYVYNALVKYGWDNVVFSILYECNSLEEMNLLEEVTIKQYNTTDNQFGYNCREGGGNYGKHSLESRAKMSKTRTGTTVTEGTRNKMIEYHLKHQGGMANRASDKTVYTFFNEDGREFMGTQYEFYTKYEYGQSSANSLIRGKRNSLFGWKVKPSISLNKYNN